MLGLIKYLRNTNISNKKIADIPVSAKKYFESIEDGEDGEEDKRGPSHVWLEGAVKPWVLVFEALDLHGFAETGEGPANGYPSQETRDGGQVCELDSD